MILLECIYFTFWSICRFFFWIITARDCEHCANRGEEYLYGLSCRYRCDLGGWTKEECENTITRKYFKRAKSR